jgi:hypothetical protein
MPRLSISRPLYGAGFNIYVLNSLKASIC